VSHELKSVWPTGKYYVAECSCGWQSPLIPSHYGAQVAFKNHRERAQNDPQLSDPGKDMLGKFHRDPQRTEQPAAEDTYPRTGTQRLRVLNAIRQAEPDGLTDRELQQNLRIRRARTRRQELVEGGWVEDSGRTRKLEDTKNKAIVWVLSERARKAS